MAAPRLSLVKLWCRVDGNDLDDLITMMIGAATEMASHETGVNYITNPMPPPVQQWCAANVGYWLANPEAADQKRVDPASSLARLLDSARTYEWTPPVV